MDICKDSFIGLKACSQLTSQVFFPRAPWNRPGWFDCNAALAVRCIQLSRSKHGVSGRSEQKKEELFFLDVANGIRGTSLEIPLCHATIVALQPCICRNCQNLQGLLPKKKAISEAQGAKRCSSPIEDQWLDFQFPINHLRGFANPRSVPQKLG